MEKKDNIQELFNNRFNDFEVSVDSQVWENIQSELVKPTGPSTSGVEKSLFTNATVWVAAVSVSAVMGIGYFMIDSNSETDSNTPNTELVESKKETKTEDKEYITPTESRIVKEFKSESQEEPFESGVNNNVKPVKSSDVSKTGNTFQATNSIAKIDNSSSHSESTKNASNEPTSSPTIVEVEAATPSKIIMASQSSVLAMPMGGIAPLNVVFSTLAENPVKIKWDFDDGTTSDEVTPSHEYKNAGIYFVTMIAELENGEVVMDKAIVEVKPKTEKIETLVSQSEIRVGNVFTPNGDGEHDEFVIICKGMQSFSMSIFTANGLLVFQTENPNVFWDGKDMSGTEVPQGTYYYLINAIGEDQNIYAPKGYISVFR